MPYQGQIQDFSLEQRGAGPNYWCQPSMQKLFSMNGKNERIWSITFRYKGETTEEQVAIAIPDENEARCTGLFKKRECSINIETGDLTLRKVLVSDHGPFVCKSGGPDSSRLHLRNLKVNGEFV